MSELMPCPFCGSEDIRVLEGDDCELFAHCSECGCDSGKYYYHSGEYCFCGSLPGDFEKKRDAIVAVEKAWNKRAEAK